MDIVWEISDFHLKIRIRDAELRGERIGEERGEQNTKRRIVDNMLKSGVSFEDIIKLTGLTAADIESLGIGNTH